MAVKHYSASSLVLVALVCLHSVGVAAFFDAHHGPLRNRQLSDPNPSSSLFTSVAITSITSDGLDTSFTSTSITDSPSIPPTTVLPPADTTTSVEFTEQPPTTTAAPPPPSSFTSEMPPFTFTTANNMTLSSSTTLTTISSGERPITSTVTQVPILTHKTITQIVTDAAGRSSTSLAVIPTTTMIPSNDPSLTNGDNKESNSGVTPKQKKVIIGVVVSIVGVLTLAGIAGLVWRIWYRGKRNEDGGFVARKRDSSLSYSRSSIQKTEGAIRTPSGSDYTHTKRSPTIINPSSNF